eukprot:CAMPEP_0178822482 /NCGR_PEP_ID=MMETSP0746-20121128/4622_1 /TAXON_ID=913974 /ORGANISM="Nitzschia punctata, Strain CCMP561" /LENGTH=163 /DNA_ID=CAMNT_0020484003 /DNA_START=26 /DNA_END=517 /DNA_ORIENTATION=-
MLRGEVKPNHLRELFLGRNHITDNGLKALGQALPNIRNLKRISLWANPFDEPGVQAFCNGLEHNNDLEDVDLFRKFSCSEKIRYYTLLNRSGRRLLQEAVATEEGTSEAQTNIHSPRQRPVPLGTWPLVLERLQTLSLQDDDVFSHNDLLYYMLKGPALFQGQ